MGWNSEVQLKLRHFDYLFFSLKVGRIIKGLLYCIVTEQCSRSSQPAALTENSSSWIQSDPMSSRVSSLDSHNGLNTFEAGFASGAYERPYEPD